MPENLTPTEPQITLGTAQLGQAYGFGAASDQSIDEGVAFAILDRAWDLGFKAVDTARLYGSAEDRIGRWIKAKGANLHVTTKTSKFAENGRDARLRLMEETKRSLDKLSIDRIDTLLFHNQCDAFHPELRDGMAALVDDGLISQWGVSVYDLTVAEQLLGTGPQVFQAPVSLVNGAFVVSGFCERARRANVVFRARSVFLIGLLLERSENISIKYPELKDAVAKIDELQENSNIDRFALLAGVVLACDGVDGIVIGADRPEQIEGWSRIIAAVKDLHPTARQLLDEFSISQTNADPREWKATGSPFVRLQ